MRHGSGYPLEQATGAAELEFDFRPLAARVILRDVELSFE
jgi:hypothetical protein